uniref:Uncharacterized protein n=1 Tax=Romanomermis culicivorax TaxID=13658 RepID=A0A915KKE2_ROMCU
LDLENNGTFEAYNETYVANGQKGDWPISSALVEDTNSSILVNNNGNETSAHLKSRLAVAKQMTPSANAFENRFLQAAIGFSKNESLPEQADSKDDKKSRDTIDSPLIESKANKNNTQKSEKDELTVLLPANIDVIDNNDTADQINAPANQGKKKPIPDAGRDAYVDNDKEGDLD